MQHGGTVLSCAIYPQMSGYYNRISEDLRPGLKRCKAARQAMVRMGMKRGEKKEGLVFRGSARRSFFAVSNGSILPLGNVFLLGLFFSLNITGHPQSLGYGDIDAGGTRLTYFSRTVGDFPARCIAQKFLDAGNRYSLIVNHLSYTADPGNVVG